MTSKVGLSKVGLSKDGSSKFGLSGIGMSIKVKNVSIGVHTFEKTSNNTDNCSICGYSLEDYVDDEFERHNEYIEKKYGYKSLSKLYDYNRKNDVCSHVSHTLCLYKWIMTSKKMTCPVCRGGSEQEVMLKQIVSSIEMIRKYRKNGILLKKYSKDGSKKIGEYRSYYRNGKVREQRMYNKRGKLHGEYCINWKTGKRCVNAYFKHDRPHNTFREYYPNGNLKSSIRYVYGKKHGKYKIWDSDGKVSLIENYYMDHKNGCKEKFVCGTRVYRGNYKFGVKYGLKEEWYSSGRIKSTGFYVGGLLHGLYRQYYEDGSLRVMAKYYENKVSDYYYEFYSNGRIKYAVDLESKKGVIKRCKRYMYMGVKSEILYIVRDITFQNLPPFIKYQIEYHLPNFCKKCLNHLMINDVFVQGNVAVLTTVCNKCTNVAMKPGYCERCETAMATVFRYCKECDVYGCDCILMSCFCYICGNCERCNSYEYARVCNNCKAVSDRCCCDDSMYYPICGTCYYRDLNETYHEVMIEIL